MCKPYRSYYKISHFAIKLIEFIHQGLQFLTFIPTFAAK